MKFLHSYRKVKNAQFYFILDRPLISLLFKTGRAIATDETIVQAVPAGTMAWKAESLGENKEPRMERIVTRAAPYLYALLRIIGALLYACHGAQKLLDLFGGVQGGTVPLLSLMGLAGLIELGAGLLIAGGVLTRPAAFLASGEMAFAYWLAHAPQGFWPIQNRGELAVLNCFLFLYIMSRGAGPWSLARLVHRQPRTAPEPSEPLVPSR
jgi:putative oxidoreductase